MIFLYASTGEMAGAIVILSTALFGGWVGYTKFDKEPFEKKNEDDRKRAVDRPFDNFGHTLVGFALGFAIATMAVQCSR